MTLQTMDNTAYHAANRSDRHTLAMPGSSYPLFPTQIYLQQLHSRAEVKADGSDGGNYRQYGVATEGEDELIEQALGATDYETFLDLSRQAELEVLRDLPLIGLRTLSCTILRNPRVDWGYPVESGYARWRLHRATKA